MDLELRPSARRVRTVVVTAGLVFAVFVMVATIAGGLLGLLGSLALCAAGLSAGYTYLRRSRIVVTATEIAVTGFRVRRRPLSEVTSVVRATVVPVRGPVQPTLFLRGAGDRVVLRIRADHYETDDLDLLIRRIGRPAIEHDRPMTAAQLAAEHPGIVPWMERRPIAFSFAVGCGTVVLVILIAGVVAALSA
jgi:hypothetical protein